MPARKKADPAFARQRRAAEKARLAGKWDLALANYTAALAHRPLPVEIKIELLEGRAACYKQTGDAKAAALDLRRLSDLLKTRLEKNSEALRQSQAENGIIASIAEALVDQTDYAGIGRLVGQKVQEFFKAEIAGVGFYNEKSGMIDVVYYYDRGKLKQVPSFKYGQGVTSYVIKTRKPLSIATEKDGKKYGAIYTEELPSKSALYAPLISGKQALGGISIQDSRPNAYSKHDLHILEAVANSMSVALENARLFDETRQRNAELAVINGVQDALAKELDLKGIYRAVGQKILEIFDTQTVTIRSFDVNEGISYFDYAYERGKEWVIPSYPTSGMMKHLVKLGKPYLLNEGFQEFLRKHRSVIPAGEPPKSFIFVPYKKEGQSVGAITIEDMDHEQAFTESDVRLLETIANTMSVALENARLFDETNQRNAELAVINAVQASLAEELDIQSIYDTVGEKLRKIFDVGAITINVYDLEANTNSYVYGFEGGKRTSNITVPINELHRFVLGQNGTFLLNTGAQQFFKRFGAKAPQGKLPKSALSVQLRGKIKQVTAVVLMDIENENAFTESDVRLLETLANSMAVALENARLFDEIQKSNREITETLEQQTATSSILRAMANSPTEIQPVLEAVAENAARLCEADDVQIYSVEADRLKQIAHFGPLPALQNGESLPLVPGLVAGRSVLERRTIHTEDASKLSKTEYPESVKLQRRLGHRTTLVTPLLREGAAIGAIVVRRNVVRPFTQKQITLLATFADQAAIAIENVRLFDQLQTRNREITEALELQTSTSDILEVIASSPEDIDSILLTIAEKAALLLKADDGVINYVEGGFFRARAHYGPIPFFKLGEGTQFNRETVTGRAMIDGKPIQAIHNPTGKKSEFPQGDKAAKEFGYAMTCAAPLMFQGKATGAIMIRRLEPILFSEKDISLLQNFANQAVIAIEKARLLNETKRLLEETNHRNAELAVINSVQQGLASSLNFQEIIDLVGEKVGEIFKADTVSAAMYDAARDWGSFAYYVDRGRRVELADGPIPRPSLAAAVVDSREPLLLGTLEESEKRGAVRYPLSKDEEDKNESVLFVPILAGEKVIGVISVQSYQRNAYNQNDLHLLQTLAGSMSIALENARLFDETAQRNAELAVINSVQEAMAKQQDIKSIYEAVGEKIREIFDAQALILGQFDHTLELVLPHYYYCLGERFYPDPIPFFGLIKHIIATGKTVTINEDLDAKGKEFGMIDVAGGITKSAVFVPLVVADKVIGGISLQNDRENAFGESDVRLLETLANSMSVALENARLFDETAQRNAELAVINSVQEAMAKQQDIKSIYEAVGEKIRGIFDAQAMILGWFDHAANRVVPHYYYEKGQRFYPDRFPFSGLIRHMISTRQIVVINENFEAKAEEFGIIIVMEPGMTVTPGTERPKSGVWVPLIAGDNVIGTISLQNIDRENAFSASDVRLLETVANSMSVALENARLFDESNRLLDESRKKEAELTTVNTVSQAVASEVELEALIQLIGDQVQKIFKADITFLALYDKTDGMIHFPYIHGETLEPIKLGEGIVSQIIRSGKPVLINRDEGWKKAERNVDRVGVRAKSYLGVPVLAGRSAIGALSVQSTQTEGRFNEADMHLLSTIAANVGAAIENARLFAEVAQQKEYFETFFRYSPAAAVVVDFKGTVISWNPAAESLFGYTAQEAIGRDVDDLVANDPQVAAEARGYTKQFTVELGRVEVRGRRTRKDGSLVDVELKGLPISVEGEMVGFLVIYHDISEFEQARRAAEEANQAKSAFLANMSHELRTPLNAIIGFTRIVRRKGEGSLPEKQIENLDKVLVSAEHLLGLINTILDIAKIEAGRMDLQLGDFDLAALIDNSLATTQPLVKENVELLKSVPEDLPKMHSDQEKIHRILLNLLSNAAKFTHEGSIKVTAKRDGEMVTLTVQDTGIGIAEENLHKVFEEFQQADNTTTRQYGGTGLGLSISRSLAQLLGGDLMVTSKEGKGSAFHLKIPINLGKAEQGANDVKAEIAAEPMALETGKRVVLVIDDQPEMFHILEQNLEDTSYQVVGARSGDEGLEKARSLHPYAITLDIMMPNKDGWQVLYELKNDPRTKDIPVIMLTIVDNKAMGFRLGATDYLLKPLEEKSVLEALERLAKSTGGVRPKRLLVVDDDPRVVDLVQQILEGQGFVIEAAKDGREALTQAQANKPDVILLDLIMPNLDGFQFIDELHQQANLHNIPIIVLTSKSLTNVEQSQLQKSVAAIVKKQGLGEEVLIQEIQKLVA